MMHGTMNIKIELIVVLMKAK